MVRASAQPSSPQSPSPDVQRAGSRCEAGSRAWAAACQSIGRGSGGDPAARFSRWKRRAGGVEPLRPLRPAAAHAHAHAPRGRVFSRRCVRAEMRQRTVICVLCAETGHSGLSVRCGGVCGGSDRCATPAVRGDMIQ
eukprot:2360698-Prymnesium_polylepis.1